jgi:hypothetical protein
MGMRERIEIGRVEGTERDIGKVEREREGERVRHEGRDE